jgi:hypothetical protein
MRMEEIVIEELLNERALIIEEINAYRESIRKFWFDTDLQIKIRENITIREKRVHEIDSLICN